MKINMACEENASKWNRAKLARAKLARAKLNAPKWHVIRGSDGQLTVCPPGSCTESFDGKAST